MAGGALGFKANVVNARSASLDILPPAFGMLRRGEPRIGSIALHAASPSSRA